VETPDDNIRLSDKNHCDFIFQELEWYADQVQEQLDRGIQTPTEYGIDMTRRIG
jgi:hypothetical protein